MAKESRKTGSREQAEEELRAKITVQDPLPPVRPHIP